PPASIYSLSLPDALPIFAGEREHDVRRPRDAGALEHEELGRVTALHLVLELLLEALEAIAALLDQRDLVAPEPDERPCDVCPDLDRKSTRPNSSHVATSY